MFTSLKRRFVFIILAPLAFMLVAAGAMEFWYSRSRLLNEWEESSILKLQRSATLIDNRLSQPLEWMTIFHQATGMGSHRVTEWLVTEFEKLDGVVRVDMNLSGEQGRRMGQSQGRRNRGMKESGTMGGMRRNIQVNMTSPEFDPQANAETVTLVSHLIDSEDNEVGELRVVMSFAYIMQDVAKSSWWQASKACLVDSEGKYIAHTDQMDKGRVELGATGDSLERKVKEAMQVDPQGTVFGAGRPPKEVAGYYSLSVAPWTLIVFASGGDILQPIITYRNHFFVIGALFVALVVFYVRFFAGKIVRQIEKISDKVRRVADGEYGSPLEPSGKDELGRLALNLNAMTEGLKQRDFIRETFGRYVDQSVAAELLSQPETVRLGGHKREVAMLMSDLRGFTPLCETLSPEEVIKIVNRYFGRMIEIIQRRHGIIVDFFGDAVLVFFDPLNGPMKPKAVDALACAMEMQRAMKLFNKESRELGLPELAMGVGVHTDSVVVGNIGSETRAKYGIVGAAVNLTARIQSVADAGEILITDAVRRHVGAMAAIDRSFTAELKGVSEETTLHVVKEIRRDSAAV